MTIGPAPMIRIEEMSVRLGIGSVYRHKKRARSSRVPGPAPGFGPARAGFRPDSAGRQRLWVIRMGGGSDRPARAAERPPKAPQIVDGQTARPGAGVVVP